MKRMLLAGCIATAGILSLACSAAIAMPIATVPARSGDLVVKADWACGPGYHIGAGGRRCWPNGRAPAYEVPPGYVYRAPVYVGAPPPILECPPGMHLGRGMRRCWPN